MVECIRKEVYEDTESLAAFHKVIFCEQLIYFSCSAHNEYGAFRSRYLRLPGQYLRQEPFLKGAVLPPLEKSPACQDRSVGSARNGP